MREFSEIMSLKRRLETRIQQMDSDPIFQMVENKEAQHINAKKAIQTLETILDNFQVLKWLIDGNISIDEMINRTQ